MESLLLESDSENEDIFFGPMTKREVKSKLKHYNIYVDELLEPLQKLHDNDVLDDSLVKYYEDLFPKGAEENWISRPAEITTSIDKSSLESSASTENYRDSLDITNMERYTESQLLNSTEEQSIMNIEDLLAGNYRRDVTNLESLTESLLVDKYTEENVEVESIENKKLEDISINNLSIDEAEQILPPKPDLFLNSSKDTSSISINSTPEKSKTISLHSSPEYSFSKSDNSGYNCTLEEMEMFLKYGENYPTENKSSAENVEEQENEPQSPIVKQSFANMEKLFLTPKNAPHRKYKHTFADIEEKENQSPIVKQFLTPSTPHRTYKQTAIPFKLPLSKKSPSYRHIVSPVAMYIKSTPKVPLMQNIPKKPIASTFRDSSSFEDDILEEAPPGACLPMRSYKPATKTALLSREEEPAMPKSIKKLMKGSTPQVIKHVGRVHQVPEKCQQVQEQGKQEDITLMQNSTVEGDVSVYVSKNALRTNRLLHS